MRAKKVEETLGLIAEIPEHYDPGEVGLAVTQARLWNLMKEKGMSRAELARRLGVAPSVVSRMLSGDGNPTVRTLSRVLAILGHELAFVPSTEKVTAEEAFLSEVRRLKEEKVNLILAIEVAEIVLRSPDADIEERIEAAEELRLAAGLKRWEERFPPEDEDGE